MAYDLSWYIENRVVVANIYATASIEQIAEISQKIANYLDDGHPPVHYIGDLSRLENFPTKIWQLQQEAEVFLRHPNLGWTVLITQENTLASFVGSMVTQLIGVQMKFAKDYADAERILKQADSTLRFDI